VKESIILINKSINIPYSMPDRDDKRKELGLFAS